MLENVDADCVVELGAGYCVCIALLSLGVGYCILCC